MSKEQVKVKILNPNAQVPTYAKEGDAGADLYSVEDRVIYPGDRLLVGTGIAIELPRGHEAQIRPRSGLAYKKGITVLNSPGTIDEGYRGEIKVLLINHSEEPFVIEQGMRIAQMVIKKFEQFEFPIVEELDSSERDAGGFGSSGE
jgi:dUTP pyrophosphatase